jgi:hypothetical protein
MNLWKPLLFLLVVVLIATVAMLYVDPEGFENPQPPTPTPTPTQPQAPTPQAPVSGPAISPTLQALLSTPPVAIPGASAPTPESVALKATEKPPVKVDTLNREQVAVASASASGPAPALQPPPPLPPANKCPECPICPDLSQYIRMDEVPCWNCTLP